MSDKKYNRSRPLTSIFTDYLYKANYILVIIENTYLKPIVSTLTSQNKAKTGSGSKRNPIKRELKDEVLIACD